MGYRVFHPRFDQPGHVYHVIQKAVAEQWLFRDDSDRERYIRQLRTIQREEDAAMQAQSLLRNHTHGLLYSGTTLHSDFMQRWATAYALSFNTRYDRQGHLFGEPFWSRPILHEPQYLGTLGYVIRNPKEAGIVRTIDELIRHPWCSLGTLMGGSSRVETQSADVLAHFSDDIEEARRLLRAWLEFSPEFDPYSDRPMPARLIEFERKAGRAFSEAFDRQQALYARQSWIITLDELVAALCVRMEVAENDLLDGSKKPAVSATRAMIAFIGVHYMGLTEAALAKRLRLAQPSVHAAVIRGRPLFVTRFGDPECADFLRHDPIANYQAKRGFG